MVRSNSLGSDSGSVYVQAIGVGFAFLVTVLAFAGLGYLADRLLGTIPVFLLLGLGLGFAAGLYRLYLALGKMDGE